MNHGLLHLFIVQMLARQACTAARKLALACHPHAVEAERAHCACLNNRAEKQECDITLRGAEDSLAARCIQLQLPRVA